MCDLSDDTKQKIIEKLKEIDILYKQLEKDSKRLDEAIEKMKALTTIKDKDCKI
ncbi:MAG: hypothetical protein NC124_02415 [Clostridium sp.]|nr:hypothetical protein [Clostridium sp.]